MDLENLGDLSPEQIKAEFERQQKEIESLKRSKAGLQGDLVKRKGVERILKAAGIDPSQEDAEDRFTDLIAKAAAASTKPADPPAKPADPPEPASGAPTPSSAVEEALRAQMASLQAEVKRLAEDRDRERQEKDRERQARLDAYKRSVIMDALTDMDCARPKHLYQLIGSNFRLLDDEETIVYGPEDDPKSVKDAVSMIQQDEEFSVYFPGSGATGSGLTSSKASLPYSDNPFAKGAANATKAAEILARDPAQARRLIQAARARGELDPILGQLQT
jgi:hypothetical protein